MNYLGVRTTGYRHPLDPKQWSRQTWGIVAAIVLLALLFGMGISHRDADEPTIVSPAATPNAKP